MTRSRQVAHAVTALREARAADSALSSSAPITFLVFEDNGGFYHWTILAADGATLGRSEGFASYDDAEQAARRVHEAATPARFQRRPKRASPVELPVELIARRDAASDDDAAERWLDEGGSFSRAAVTR